MKQAKILVMDEDLAIQTLLLKILSRACFSVASTTSVQEAYEIIMNAIKENEPFDVVIADLTINQSSERGAISLLEKINGTFPKIAIIAHSGWLFAPEILFPKKYGFTASLSKPSSNYVIINTILKVLSSKQIKESSILKAI